MIEKKVIKRRTTLDKTESEEEAKKYETNITKKVIYAMNKETSSEIVKAQEKEDNKLKSDREKKKINKKKRNNGKNIYKLEINKDNRLKEENTIIL